MNWAWLHRYASPPHFYRTAGRMIPWFSWLAAITGAAGLIGGLGLAPPDYQQGEGYRIIFVHVPAAVLSTMAYAVMAGCGRRGPDLAHECRPRRGGQLRQHRGLVHGPRTGHRQSVGTTHVGHLLGSGIRG